MQQIFSFFLCFCMFTLKSKLNQSNPLFPLRLGLTESSRDRTSGVHAGEKESNSNVFPKLNISFFHKLGLSGTFRQTLTYLFNIT